MSSPALPRIDLLSQLQVDADGTVHVPAMAAPVSPYLSPEGRAWVIEHLHQNQSPELQRRVDGNPVFLDPYIDRVRTLFPTTVEDTHIGGVHVHDYRPAEGVGERNGDRVLIALHAGAFHEGWPSCAQLQAIPICSLGRIRVVAVNYRKAPDHAFPAASEDVAAVYAELLKTYPAENIGVFGASAGGQLTAMAIAWFQTHGLPRPGAIGLYSAGAVQNGAGDAAYTAAPIGEAMPPPEPPTSGQGQRRGPSGYLAGADRSDPLVNPAASDAVLSQFPPTQVITGTRHFDLSAAVYTHTRLIKLGVQAELHVWEGLFHFFFLNPDVPESRDAYEVMVRFFDRRLGRRHPPGRRRRRA
jgi:monoterpene epsilon-lactone hydrolase